VDVAPGRISIALIIAFLALAAVWLRSHLRPAGHATAKPLQMPNPRNQETDSRPDSEAGATAASPDSKEVTEGNSEEVAAERSHASASAASENNVDAPVVPTNHALLSAGILAASESSDASRSITSLNVLLVGGLPHVVELESRWLPITSAEILWERNWAAAVRCLLCAPPDLIVLNSLTDDGTTSEQMFQWILANRPELREHTIVIRGQGSPAGNPSSNADVFLTEPLDYEQWRQAVVSRIFFVSLHGAAPVGEAAAHLPTEATELRTLLDSAMSYGPLVDGNAVQNSDELGDT
jgi:hypothetical protein